MVKASTQYKRTHKADYGREKIQILYEDQWIAVILKPSGMLSVPYPGSRARTAIAVLEELMRKNGTYSAKHRPFTVHRLDRDTSGVMMFALNEQAQQKIMNSWQTMVSERLYRAVAENPDAPFAAGNSRFAPLGESGIIDEPLAFNAHNVGFVPQTEDRAFKTVEARTNFRIVLRGKTHTLFELSLDTGKKNQIRAHLASKGYPLAGDENYRAHTDPFHRLALHACTLAFTHPYTGKPMSFAEPEPAEWTQYVKRGEDQHVPPVWDKNAPATGNATHAGNASTHSKHRKSEYTPNEAHITQNVRLPRKAVAHMNFIEQGKAKKH